MGLFIQIFLVMGVLFLFLLLGTVLNTVKRVKRLRASNAGIIRFRIFALHYLAFVLYSISFVLLIYLFYPSKSLIKEMKDKRKGPIVILNIDCNWYARYRGGIGGLFQQLDRLFSLPAAFQVNFFENYSLQKIYVSNEFAEITLPDDKYRSNFRRTFLQALSAGTTHVNDKFVFNDNQFYSIRNYSTGRVDRFIEVLNRLEEVRAYFSGNPKQDISVAVFVVFISPSPAQNFDTYLSSIRGPRGFSGGGANSALGTHYYYANILVNSGWGVTGPGARVFDQLVREIESSKQTIDFPRYETYFCVKQSEKAVWSTIILFLMFLSLAASIFLNRIIISF